MVDKEKLDSYKEYQAKRIYESFKIAIEETEIPVMVSGNNLVVASSKDKNAYKDVYTSLLADTDYAWIKDCKGNQFNLSKIEIHTVLKAMIDKGIELWTKKELAIQDIHSFGKHMQTMTDHEFKSFQTMIDSISW